MLPRRGSPFNLGGWPQFMVTCRLWNNWETSTEITRMLLDRAFEPFLAKRPVCVMARAVLENLLASERLDELFQRTAVRQRQRGLLFSSLVGLMSEVTLKIQPSVHPAHQSRAEELKGSAAAPQKKPDCVERS